MKRRPPLRYGLSRRLFRGAEGLTVLELTVAMALVMLIMAPVLMFVATAQRNQSALYNSTGAQADARQAINTVARNLRDAEYPAGTTYASTNSDMFAGTPSATDITFFSEVDAVQGTNLSNGTIYQVEYVLSGNSLIQKMTPPSCTGSTCTYPSSGTMSRTLLSDVVNSSTSSCSNGITATSLFTFYEQNIATGQLEALVDQPNSINYVQMALITGPTSGKGTCTEIQTSVSLRNWRP